MATINANDSNNFTDGVPVHSADPGGIVLSEYIGQLIDAGQKEKAREILEAEVLKGINSGPPEPWTSEDLAEIRAELLRRCVARKAEE